VVSLFPSPVLCRRLLLDLHLCLSLLCRPSFLISVVATNNMLRCILALAFALQVAGNYLHELPVQPQDLLQG
jgi:hypothetical protein